MSELSDALLLKVRPEERPALRFLAQAQHDSIMQAVATVLQYQTQARAADKLEAEVAEANAENARYQAQLDEQARAKAAAELARKRR
jgi:hypothetical protein